MYVPTAVGVHVAVDDVLLIVCPSDTAYEYDTVPSAFATAVVRLTVFPSPTVVAEGVSVASKSPVDTGSVTSSVSSLSNNILEVASIGRPSPLGYWLPPPSLKITLTVPENVSGIRYEKYPFPSSVIFSPGHAALFTTFPAESS